MDSSGMMMAGGGHNPPPLAIGRVLIPVKYLASCAIHTAQSVAHFYLVAENSSRIPKNKNAQKRVAILADRATFQADLDAALNRCVMFSQIEELSLLDEHLGPLTGPFSEIDYVVQQSPAQDFQRVVSAIFKPNTAVNTVPTYVLEQGNAVSSRAHCRLALNALQDVVGTAAQEASVKQVRVAKDREVLHLQEALTKQKDESLLEMVELHTQKETLKHALGQAEQVISSTRRQQKEEKDMLLSKIRQLEAERDIKLGKAPGAGPRFDESTLSIPAASVSGSFATGGVRTPNSPRGGGNPLHDLSYGGQSPVTPGGLGSGHLGGATTLSNTYGSAGGFSTPGSRPMGRDQIHTSPHHQGGHAAANLGGSAGPQQYRGVAANNSTIGQSMGPGAAVSSYAVQSPDTQHLSGMPQHQYQHQQQQPQGQYGSDAAGGSGFASHQFSPSGAPGNHSFGHQSPTIPQQYGPSASAGGQSSMALDQLQHQLNDGERFLVSLQKKKSESGAW